MLPLRDLWFQGHEGAFQGPKLRCKCQCIHQTDRSHAVGALHAKEEEGWGGGAHREWCRVEERGDKERLWVSA